MGKLISSIATILSASFVLAIATPTVAQTSISSQQNINTDIELLRTDVRAAKSDIIARTLNLTEAQSAAFWPVYRGYEYEFSRIIDQKIELIRIYTRNYDNLPEDKAKQLVEKSFQLDDQTTNLKRKYFKEFRKVLPLNTVARFFQIENQIDRLIELQITSELPLVK